MITRIKTPNGHTIFLCDGLVIAEYDSRGIRIL